MLKKLLRLFKIFYKMKKKYSSRIVIPAPKKIHKKGVRWEIIKKEEKTTTSGSYNNGVQLFRNYKKKRKNRVLREIHKQQRKELNDSICAMDSKQLVLTLDRMWYTEKSTIGQLYIDGMPECLILEDYDRLRKNRRKVYGETAIPRGTYEIRLTYSRKFNRTLPLLRSVPGFSGIRIHAGNTAKDTEGCLLPGTTKGTNSVGQSKRAFRKLYKKLEGAKRAGKKIIIKIDPV